MKTFHIIDEKKLLIAIQVLVGFIFLVPLITSSHFYFPFIVPRTLFFRTGVELLLVLYVVLVLQNRNYLPQKNIVWILLVAFISLLTFSSIIGNDPQYSFWSTFERMEGLINFYHLLAFFFVLYGSLRERAAWERLLQTSLFIALVLAIVGLSQLFGVNLLLASSGGERISSTIGNATYFAAYLLIHVFFALYFIVKRKEVSDLTVYKYGFIVLDVLIIYLHVRYGLDSSEGGLLNQIFVTPKLWIPFVLLQALAFADFWTKKAQRYSRELSVIFYVLMTALFVFMITTTQTRGALVGLGLSALFACVYLVLRRKEKMRVRIISFSVFAVGVILLTLVFANKDATFIKNQPLLNKIASISLSDATTRSRLVTWQAGLKGFAERPVFGWGVENFHIVFNKYFPTVLYTDEGTPLWFDRPHNLLIQYLVEGGVAGLLAYLAFLGAIIVLILKRFRNHYTGVLLAAFVVAYFGQNLFVFDSINSYIPFFVGVAFISYLIVQRDDSPVASSKPVRSSMGIAVAAVTVLAIASALWVFTVRPLTMNRNFVTLYQRLNREWGGAGFNAETPDQIFAALDAGPYVGKNELLGVLSEYLVGMIQEKRLPDEKLAPIVAKTSERLDRRIKLKADDARLNLLLMNLYLNAVRLDRGYADKLISVGEPSLSLSPTRPHMYYVIGRARMIKRQYAEGLVNFKKAVELAPNVYDSHWNLFLAYVTVGDKESAVRELVTLRSFGDLSLIQYKRIASVYAAGRNFLESEEILKEAIGKFPNSAELYAALADVLLSQDKFNEARTAVAQAVKIDPSIKDQADAFLKVLEEKERAQKGIL